MNLQDLKINREWTLFLDRDGVINRRIVGDYVKQWEQFEFLPGVLDSIAGFSDLFGRILVVSNQQGVGKGLMSDHQVNEIHRQMVNQIETAGGRIDAVFYSPHRESDRSIMRKPGIGMALRARKQFPEIRFNQSIMAGDSLSDMIFGKRAGMKTVYLSNDLALARKHPRQIDMNYPDLSSFAHDL